MIEDSIYDGDYDFDGANTLFIKRQIQPDWRMTTVESLSPKGETKLIIRNPTGKRVFIHLVIQGYTTNHMQIKSYVNDIQSLTNICNHHGEYLPFMLELNEIVSDETRIVIDFKGLTLNSSFLNSGSITGFISKTTACGC